MSAEVVAIVIASITVVGSIFVGIWTASGGRSSGAAAEVDSLGNRLETEKKGRQTSDRRYRMAMEYVYELRLDAVKRGYEPVEPPPGLMDEPAHG